MKEKYKDGFFSSFIEEMLKEDPQMLVFSQAGTMLADYMNAYVLMKKEGDMPSSSSFLFRDFQTCLLFTLEKRITQEEKSIQ